MAGAENSVPSSNGGDSGAIGDSDGDINGHGVAEGSGGGKKVGRRAAVENRRARSGRVGIKKRGALLGGVLIYKVRVSFSNGFAGRTGSDRALSTLTGLEGCGDVCEVEGVRARLARLLVLLAGRELGRRMWRLRVLPAGRKLGRKALRMCWRARGAGRARIRGLALTMIIHLANRA